jgi:hypothetical protein
MVIEAWILIRIDFSSWIRIRGETNMDSQHCLSVHMFTNLWVMVGVAALDVTP